ncbi:MAG: PAQR family membrane homeostasis protein TrhA, partial [Pseudonocardiaceae bacterium]
LYHRVNWVSATARRWMRRLDHSMIFFLIAGTYTPLSLIMLDGPVGWGLLTAVWAIAALGVPFKILFLEAPVWLSTATYLGMGYLSLVALVPLTRAVPPSGVAWLVAGGVAYTVGAIIFTRRRPDPLPGIFGHHEIWHILVLVGSACHFAFMIFHVAPA